MPSQPPEPPEPPLKPKQFGKLTQDSSWLSKLKCDLSKRPKFQRSVQTPSKGTRQKQNGRKATCQVDLG
jgi:hypothetical protein